MLRQFAILSFVCLALAVIYGKSISHRFAEYASLDGPTGVLVKFSVGGQANLLGNPFLGHSWLAGGLGISNENFQLHPPCIYELQQGKRWEELPNVTFHFDCSDKAIGFYADTEFGCMIFHMCDEDGRRIPHLCGHNTAFNQQYRVCDWISNFDCNDAPKWYYLNELTYVTDPPKVAV